MPQSSLNRLRQIGAQTRVPLTPTPLPQQEPSQEDQLLSSLLKLLNEQPEQDIAPPTPVPLPQQRQAPQGFWRTLAEEILPRSAEATIGMEGGIDKRRAAEDAAANERYKLESGAQQSNYENQVGAQNQRRLTRANSLQAVSPIVAQMLARRDRPPVSIGAGGLYDPNTGNVIAGGSGGYQPADVRAYEYAQQQGYTGTLEDWMKVRAQGYGEIRSRQLINPNTGQPSDFFPMTGQTVPAPPGLITPTFALQAANAKADFAAADSMLNEIETNASKIITAQGPMAAWVQAGLDIPLGRLTRDPDVVTYFATRDAFLSMLTRAAGERGVLTTQDVERIKNALPGPLDTYTIAQRKMTTLRSLFRSIVDARLKAFGAQPPGTPGISSPDSTPPPAVPQPGPVTIPQGSSIGAPRRPGAR